MNKYKVKIEEEILPNSFTLDELIESGLLDEYDGNIKVRATNESTWYVAREFPFHITEKTNSMNGYIINEDGSIRRSGTSTSRLDLSTQSLSFTGSGSTQTIIVTANGPWEISVGTASWVHLTKTANSLIVRVDKNYNSTSRTDYFKLKSGTVERQVNITQSGSYTPTPSADNDNNGCVNIIVFVFIIWLLLCIFS